MVPGGHRSCQGAARAKTIGRFDDVPSGMTGGTRDEAHSGRTPPGAAVLHRFSTMGHMFPALTVLVGALLCLAGTSSGRPEPPLRAGTIVIGIPRENFVVLGADRLWTSALPKPGDPSWERRGQQVKIARHDSLPLAVAAAGLATLGPRQDTVEYVRELITPLDGASLSFDAIVGRLQPPLQESLRAVRDPARRALAANPADTEAQVRLKVARLTLLVAYVTAGQATFGWIEIHDTWKAKRASPPRGAVAWPDALDAFYTRGPYASAEAMFGYSIQEPARLAAHVRRVIEGGIQEDARLNLDRDRHVGGPVDVVLVDSEGARCVPPCSPP
jgi:hypothetical protein